MHLLKIAVLAALVGLAATAALAVEDVTFPSADAPPGSSQATPIPAKLYRPAGAGPFPAIVLLHGCGGVLTPKGQPLARDRDWVERWVGLGYLVLAPDSFTPRGLRAECSMEKQPVSPFLHRNRDAYGALLYLQSRPDVIADRIGLMGWSHGGSTVLGTVNSFTHSRPKTGLKADFRAAVAFYPGCAAPEHDAHWGTQIPVLVLIGAKDIWTPAADCVALAQREKAQGDPLDLVVYPDAVHDFDAPHQAVHELKGVNFRHGGTALLGTDPKARADAIPRVTEFFAQRLKP